MGQELETTEFSDADFQAFTERLKTETDLLRAWEREGMMSRAEPSCGFELEAWLVDEDSRPAGRNLEFIDTLNSPLVVPELSSFNVEFNADPSGLDGMALSAMQADLSALWREANTAAEAMGLRLAMIGILPTVQDHDLCTDSMTKANRFKALNEQVFRLRKGKPIKLDIDGTEHLKGEHLDVMLEAAATSFQIHLRVPSERGVDFYNASKLASIPLLAVSANSPFLMGKDLWAETRIPLFEQAVSVGDWDYAERVTYGVRFIEESLSEVFLANRQRYPILLPQLSDNPSEKLPHLRLQNGTIWRWNRPLIGWDDDGTPHYRLEQRVVPAGPTVTDSIANAAFYYGLVTFLANDTTRPHQRTQFFTARDNFYEVAKHGLDAKIRWDHTDDQPISSLILDVFLEMAETGLISLGVDEQDISRYLGIIEARTRTGRNGTAWQRAFVAKHKASMKTMLDAYIVRQQTETPVHEWPL